MRTMPLLRSVAIAVAALAASSGPAMAYTKIVSFGDSLTDTGNLLQVTTILSGLGLSQPLPQPGDYFNGRFSNGRVAVEVLADGLVGSIGDGRSLFLQNYAYGGAKTGTTGQLPNTGLLSQLGAFKSSLQPGAKADADALYFVWGGANDLRAVAEDPSQAFNIVSSALNNLGSMVVTLYGLGARNFLLPNLPDIGLTPEARSNGPAGMQGATFLSELFNDQLGRLYAGLAQALPGSHLITFDTMSAQRALSDNPSAAGLTNVTDACFSGYVGIAGTVCASPSEYLYYDRVHPTTAVHEVLGMQMLAAVPEPATVLTMGLGVLALLGQARRRRRGA